MRMTDAEFTGPGSVSKVFEWHLKQGLDASGRTPIIIKAVSPKPKKLADFFCMTTNNGTNR